MTRFNHHTLLSITLLLLSQALYAQLGTTAKLVYNSGSFDIPAIIQVADVDGDGDNDVLIKETFARPVFWVANDGKGTFSSRTELPQSNLNDITALETFDCDNDGDLDVIAAYSTNGSVPADKVLLWKNYGSGYFSSPITIVSNVENVASLTPVDIDNDGYKDVVVGVEYEQSFWLKNDAKQGQWINQNLTQLRNADFIRVVDIDKDGALDYISLADNGPYGVTINGKTLSSPAFSISRASFLHVADMDGDGDLDIMASNYRYQDGILFIENRDGKYVPRVLDNSAKDYRAITAFDYDNDGDIDILATCFYYCGTELFENIGAGRFTYKPTSLGSGVQAHSLIAADMNGDNIPEVVKLDAGSHTVTWFSNTTPQFQGITSDFIFEGRCEGDMVKFYNTARGKNIVSWEWNFGDGTFSTEHSPTHQYNTSGTFKATFKVTNAAGQQSIASRDIVLNAAPQVDSRDLSACGDSQTTITLPSEFTYTWYTQETGGSVFTTGNPITFNTSYYNPSITRYYVKTDPTTGCSSTSRGKVAVKYVGYPLSRPRVQGAVSYNGPATMILQASVEGSGGTLEWYRSPTDDVPFKTGVSHTQYFEQTTTFYVRVRNTGGCVSGSVPVMAEITSDVPRTPQYVWAKAPVALSQNRSEGINVTLDPQGNPAAYGAWFQGMYVTDSDTLKGGPGNVNRFIIRYDKAGNTLSAKRLAYTTYSMYYAPLANDRILIDKQDNIYFMGTITGTVIIGEQVVSLPAGATSATVLAKLDSQGKMIWHHVFQGNTINMQLTSQNGIYLYGRFTNTITIAGKSLNYGSCFLANFDTTGKLMAANSMMVPAASGYVRYAIDNQGNLCVVAPFDKTANFGSMTLTDPAEAVFAAKYSASGTLLWAKKISANADYANIQAITTDSKNEIIMVGQAGPVDPSQYVEILGTTLPNANSTFMARLTANGDPVWTKSIVNDGQLEVNELRTDKDDNFYFLGFHLRRLTIDGFSIDDLGTFSSYIMKLTPTGKVAWAKQIDQIGFSSFAPDEEGNVYVVGGFEKNVTLDEHNLSTTVPTANENVFLTKIGNVYKADFKYSTACQNMAIAFTDASMVVDAGRYVTAWEWDFGDGSPDSNKQNPVYTYDHANTYFVRLTVTDNTGAKATTRQPITIGKYIAPRVSILKYVGDNTICEGNQVSYRAEGRSAGDIYTYTWYVNDKLTTDGNGPYLTTRLDKDSKIKVTFETRDNGCILSNIAMDSVSVNVKRFPDAPEITVSASTLCMDGTATLTAPGDYKIYRWSNGENTKSIMVTAEKNRPEYTVSVGDLNFCMSRESKATTLDFVPNPEVSIASNNSGTLSATAGFASYTWYKNNEPLEVYTREYRPTETATYTVAVTTPLGCEALSAGVDFTVLGVEENGSNTVSLYPNPARNTVRIEAKQTIKQVKLVDMMGRVLKTIGADFYGNLDIANLPAGNYVLTVVAGNETYQRTLVKID